MTEVHIIVSEMCTLVSDMCTLISELCTLISEMYTLVSDMYAFTSDVYTLNTNTYTLAIKLCAYTLNVNQMLKHIQSVDCCDYNVQINALINKSIDSNQLLICL